MAHRVTVCFGWLSVTRPAFAASWWLHMLVMIAFNVFICITCRWWSDGRRCSWMCDSVPANCAMVSVGVVNEAISLCFRILVVCYVSDSIADLQALIW